MSESSTLSRDPSGGDTVSARQASPAGKPDPHPRSDTGTIVIHWIVVAAMVASLITGLRISADAPVARTAKLLAPLLPQG